MRLTPSKNIAANVRRHREDRGWSIDRLAEELAKVGHPISRSAVSKLELRQRKIDVDVFFALAEALNTSPYALVTDPVTDEATLEVRRVWEQYQVAMAERQRAEEVSRAAAAAAERSRNAHDAVIRARTELQQIASTDDNARRALRDLLQVDDPRVQEHRDVVSRVLGGDHRGDDARWFVEMSESLKESS